MVVGGGWFPCVPKVMVLSFNNHKCPRGTATKEDLGASPCSPAPAPTATEGHGLPLTWGVRVPLCVVQIAFRTLFSPGCLEATEINGGEWDSSFLEKMVHEVSLQLGVERIERGSRPMQIKAACWEWTVMFMS